MHPLHLKYREKSFEFLYVRKSTLPTQQAALALLYNLSLLKTKYIFKVKLESSNRDPQILGTSKQFELRTVHRLYVSLGLKVWKNVPISLNKWDFGQTNEYLTLWSNYLLEKLKAVSLIKKSHILWNLKVNCDFHMSVHINRFSWYVTLAACTGIECCKYVLA